MSKKQADLQVIVTDTAVSIVSDYKEQWIFTVDEASDGDHSEIKLYAIPNGYDDTYFISDVKDFPKNSINIEIADMRKPTLEKRTTTPATPQAVAVYNENVTVRNGSVAVTTLQADQNVVKSTALDVDSANLNTNNDEYFSPLEQYQRDMILDAIAESYKNFPAQTDAFRAAASHEIAEEVFGEDTPHNVSRVAGVRAALRRGRYDMTIEDMIGQ